MLKINRRQLIGGAGMALAAPAIIGATSASADDMYGEPKPNVGTIKYLPNFNSKHVSPRDVAIWTPDPDTFDGPLPVIYAGDGEGLFDPDVSKYGSSWNLDLILNMMAIQGYGPAIVVANAAVHKDRSREYNSPTIAKYFDSEMRELLTQSCGGDLMTNSYFDFLVEELKPYVDANFDTKPDRSNTFAMGASMGGMMAFEALMLRPETFSRSIGFSSHLFLFGPEPADYPQDGPARVDLALQQAIAENFPDPGDTRAYFDRGTLGLDAWYERSHITIEKALVEKGYTPGKDVMAVVQEGAGHFDAFWKMRAPKAFKFLLS